MDRYRYPEFPATLLRRAGGLDLRMKKRCGGCLSDPREKLKGDKESL
jgi:hypothetical protein